MRFWYKFQLWRYTSKEKRARIWWLAAKESMKLSYDGGLISRAEGRVVNMLWRKNYYMLLLGLKIPEAKVKTIGEKTQGRKKL